MLPKAREQSRQRMASRRRRRDLHFRDDLLRPHFHSFGRTFAERRNSSRPFRFSFREFFNFFELIEFLGIDLG